MDESTEPVAVSCFAPEVLAGSVALVTGGGTGIGREIARVLGAHGARVAWPAAARRCWRTPSPSCRATGIDASFGVCDVRDTDAVPGSSTAWSPSARVPRHRRQQRRRQLPGPMSADLAQRVQGVVDIDLLGTYNVTRAAFDAWLGTTAASIVNISAPFEQRGVVYQAHVAAAKSGVDSLTRTCAVGMGSLRHPGQRHRHPAPCCGDRGPYGGSPRSVPGIPTPTNPLGRHGPRVGHRLPRPLPVQPRSRRFISGQVIAVDGAGATRHAPPAGRPHLIPGRRSGQGRMPSPRGRRGTASRPSVRARADSDASRRSRGSTTSS